MSYPPPSQPGPGDSARLFVVMLVIVLLISGAVFGGERIVPLEKPADTIAVETLIAQFDSQDVILRTDADGCLMYAIPAFSCYAEACAKLDGCVPLLIDVLGTPTDPNPPEGFIPVVSPQARLAAACALEAVGPEAIQAEPLLRTMLETPDVRENIMALGIIRGIGPDAASLLGPVRTLLYAENFHVRYWACRAVASMGDAGEPAVADLCLLLMMDEPASVRRNACIALGEVAGCSVNLGPAVRVLEEIAADDYSHPVRVAARAALEKFFGPPITPERGQPTLAK